MARCETCHPMLKAGASAWPLLRSGSHLLGVPICVIGHRLENSNGPPRFWE